MPETQEAPVANKELFQATRNDVSVQFVEAEKARGSDKPPIDPETKQPDPYALLKGQKYPAPNVTVANFDTWAKWLGVDYVVKAIAGKLNIWAQGLWEECMEQAVGDAQKALDLFQIEAAKFSPRGESKAVLLQQLMDLTEEMGAIDTRPPEATTPEAVQAYMENMRNYNKKKIEFESIATALRNKKRTRSNAEETEQQAQAA